MLQKGIDNSVKYKLLFALLGLAGAGIILFATSQYGAGISPDSVDYIATARHIADGTGFITYNNAPLIAQPPLYPIILGVTDSVLGLDPFLSAGIVNAILFGITLYLSGLLFSKHLNSSPIFALIGTASLLVSIPLVSVSLMAWSEPLFIFFVVLYFISISMYLEKKNIKSLSLLSAAVALACLTRYIGVILIFTGIISILLIRQDELKTKFLHASIFAFISVLPVGIWAGRNYLLSGTLFGPRSPSLHTLYYNIRQTFLTIFFWYFPSRPILVMSILIICFFVGMIMIFVWGKTPIMTLLKQTRPFVIFMLLTIISFTGFLIVSSTITNYDRISDRLLSPIVVPMTLLLLYVIETLSKPIKTRLAAKPVELLIMAGFLLWLIYPARTTASNIIIRFNKGYGYGAKSWKNSETIQYIRENNLSDCAIYSNGADVTYLLININVNSIPLKSSGADDIADISSLKNTFPAENKACIVWFNRIKRSYLFTPDELISVTNLEQVIQLDDGAIYVVSRK